MPMGCSYLKSMVTMERFSIGFHGICSPPETSKMGSPIIKQIKLFCQNSTSCICNKWLLLTPKQGKQTACWYCILFSIFSVLGFYWATFRSSQAKEAHACYAWQVFAQSTIVSPKLPSGQEPGTCLRKICPSEPPCADNAAARVNYTFISSSTPLTSSQGYHTINSEGECICEFLSIYQMLNWIYHWKIPVGLTRPEPPAQTHDVATRVSYGI